MRRTKNYFEKRTARLARNIKMLGHEEMVLEGYNPGDHRRYQIVIRDKKTFHVIFRFPRYGSLRTNEFDWYLTGLLDAIEEGLRANE